MLRTLLIITPTTPVNETLVFYLGRKRKLRRNLRKSMERLLAPEKHFAFRGRLLSLGPTNGFRRSEEHTSELQSRGHLVCRLLPEKKKNNTTTTLTHNDHRN